MFFHRALKLYSEESSASSGGSTQQFEKNTSGPLIEEARIAGHEAYVKKYNELKDAAEKNAYKFDEEAAIIQAKIASDEAYVAKEKEVAPKLKLEKEFNDTKSLEARSKTDTDAAYDAFLTAAKQYPGLEESLKQQLASGKITKAEYDDNLARYNKVVNDFRDIWLKEQQKLKEHTAKRERLDKLRSPNKRSKNNVNFKDKFAGTRTRLTDQAALIINISQIAQKKHTVQVGTKVNSNRTKSAIKANLCRYDVKYKNFSLARLGTSGHYAITSLITKHSSMNVFFNKLPPQVLSLLIPTIKLYKVFYPKIEEELKENGGRGIPKETFDWRIPFDDIPVKYFNQTSEVVPDTLDDILNGNGSLHAVGIKSFSYKYEGNNPATANTLLSADLKLFFENPEELVKQYNLKGPNNIPYTFHYSDLVNQSSRTIANSKSKNAPNEHYYRIKVICGFTDVNIDIIADILKSKYKDDQVQSIIDAIKVSKVTLYLSPYSYDINFTENGSAELSIKYSAAIDAIMISEDTDIFNSSETSKKIIEARKEFELLMAAKNNAQKIKDNPSANICPDDEEEKYFDQFIKGKSLKDVEEQLKLRVFNTKKEAYKNIYRRLIGLEKTSNSTNKLNGLYSAKIKTDLINALTVTGIKAEQREKEIKKHKGVQEVTLVNVNNIPTIQKFIDDLKYQTASNKGKSSSPTMDEQAKKRIDQIHKSNMANAGKGYSTIKFFFLGDIIDAALECFDNIQSDYDRPRLILGEIPISIPAVWDDKGIVQGYAPEPLFANLADIPISFDFFMQFFVDKVIKTQRERYSAMEFIKDIISTLIIPSVSPSMFGIKESPNTRIKYSLLNFNVNTIIRDGKEVDPFTNSEINDRNTFIFYDDGEIKKKQIDLNDANLKDIKDSFIDIKKTEYTKHLISVSKESKNNPSVLTYLYVYCSSKFPKQFTGKEEEDINYGVYHVRMGSDSGIIKKIIFKKSNMPFQREFLARRQGSGKGTVLKQVYNADITMFGNNIYVPGDYIFIEPYYLSRNKKATDLQDTLGLGGYYMVIKVFNNITEASFETRLECIFQAPVVREGNTTKAVPIDEDVCIK